MLYSLTQEHNVTHWFHPCP